MTNDATKQTMATTLAALWSCILAMTLVGTTCVAAAAERQPGDYPLQPDSLVQPGVPRGSLLGPFEFHSQIFAGTVRRYWIYVPAQYDKSTPASVLVFQDGQRAVNPTGSLRVPVVLDNLIHRGDIPVTIGIFITPGHLAETYPDTLGMSNPDHRAAEYDALDDRYSRLIVDEILPSVASRYRLTDDPKQRAIGGTSSGAICAFTVAWHRPDMFRKVISIIGSYVSIGYRPAQDGQPMVPGGDLYPGLIRKSPIRPLRIFLQDGSNDLDNEHGNWFLANQQMLASFTWANAEADRQKSSGPRYEVTHVWGDGAHSDAHGGSLLPDILRWLWRDDRVAGPVQAEVPEWAYALNPPAAQPATVDDEPQRVPESAASFTSREIAAIADRPPDWHPDEHPAMPGIVGRSREPRVYACAYCHLPNGAGRPENASLAGLSANYIRAQILAFREGRRPGSEPRRVPQNNMIAIARQLTDSEAEEAATYFAALPSVSFVKVVESSTVPRTVVAGWMLAKAPGSSTEPIGDRIIELAADVQRFQNRDSRTPYIAYVPMGSITRGADLVTTGAAGRTTACAVCHGSDLNGLADVPRIKGRSPSYLFRQLNDFRSGTRKGGASELMKTVVANLTDADMVAIAAYLASTAS